MSKPIGMRKESDSESQSLPNGHGPKPPGSAPFKKQNFLQIFQKRKPEVEINETVKADCFDACLFLTCSIQVF